MNDIIEKDIDNIWREVDLSEMAGKLLLITGATGLIGTYLIHTVKKFNAESKEPISLCLVTHNELPAHLAFLKNEPYVKIYRGDLSVYDFCQALPNADYIIHAAGYGQPGKFMANKMKTLRLNTLVTDILLKKLNRGGKFLFISTSEIYSGATDIPYREESHGVTMPNHARACYIEGKRCGEAMCYVHAKNNEHVRIARIALAYGPGVRASDKRVLYNFIQKGLQGTIDMMDRGEARRTYCYVADTVSLLWNILLKGKEIIYNVGGHSHVTIRELADLVAQNLKAKVVIPQEVPGVQGAPQDVFLDMTKAENEFGKSTYVPIEIGIQQTVSWYEENLFTGGGTLT